MHSLLRGPVSTSSVSILHQACFCPLGSLRQLASKKQLLSGIAAMSDDAAVKADIWADFASDIIRTSFCSSFQLAPNAPATLHLPAQQQRPAGSSGPEGVTAVKSWLDTAAVLQQLKTHHMGHVLLCTLSIASTQEFMRMHTNTLPDGAVLVADQQTRGKGRGGNVWTSPEGCLMFTALRQLRVPGEQAAFINYVVCLAVVQGIKDATQHLLEGGLDVQIKWPNDIYHAGIKIGGALIHTTWAASSQQFCVLTGIGLNVSNSQPTTCLDDIICARHPAGVQMRVCKEQLLASILNHLESCFDTFQQHGFDPLRPLYLSSWMHSNQVVELDGDGSDGGRVGQGGGQQGVTRVTLTIVSLSPHGFLLAEDEAGQRYELTPDGNSLDMMQGLIRKKLP